MSFWGVQLKPGKPITHSCENARGRLRISQATLGIGDATKKTVVQCNVGNRSPVLLCALLPGVTESTHLELEFAEADDVVFSVIGPRSVYLTGYYVAEIRAPSGHQSDSESYGVDIQNSHSEESGCHSEDDDEYEDSFIDDGKLEVLPSSPESSINSVDETDPESVKPKEKNVRRRQLRKKCQVVESDSDANTPENDDDDKHLLSFLMNKEDKSNTKDRDAVKAAKAGGEANSNSKSKDAAGPQVGTSKANRERESNKVKNKKEAVFSNDKVITDANTPENEEEDKFLFSLLKKKKDTVKTKQADSVKAAKAGDVAKGSNLCNSKLQEKAGPQIGNGQANRAVQSNQVKNKKEAKVLADDNGNENNAEAKATNQNIPTGDMEMQNDEINGKQKRKRKERSKTEEKTCEVNVDEDHTDVKNGKKSKKIKKEHKVEDTCTVPAGDKPVQDVIHIGSDIKDLLKASGADEQHIAKEPEKKTRKKTKKKTQEESKATNEMSTNKRTLSNGLSIEVLANGSPDGKVAEPGKKVKLYYTAMIKETGQVFDSNVGKTPMKYRLGDKESIDGWNIGIDGMRVGEKRRLIIPPSTGFRNHEENVPPESWLVYDVELVSVHK